MRLAALVSIVFLVLTSSLLAQESLPPGRYLPDGTFQPRNLYAILPDPSLGEGEHSPSHGFEGFLSLGWEPEVLLGPASGSFFMYYPKVFEDSGDMVHIIGWDMSAGPPLYYTRSTDGGSTWEEGRYLYQEGPQPGSCSILGDKDTLSIVFTNTSYIYTLISTDMGLTWSDWQEHLYSPGPTSMQAVEHGGIYWLAMRDAQSRFWLLRSTNHGIRWQIYNYINNSGYTRTRLGINNTSFNVVVESPGGEIFHTRRGVSSETTWTALQMISEDVWRSSFNPLILAWGDSSVAAVWTDYQYSPYPWTGDIFLRVSDDAGLSWRPVLPLTSAHFSLGKDLFVRGDTLYLVYDELVPSEDRTYPRLFFNMSTDKGYTWGEPQRLMPGKGPSRDGSVFVAGDRVHVGFCDSRDTTTQSFALYYKRGKLSQTGIFEEEESPRPEEMGLSAYPNPFNSSTTITVSVMAEAEIAIYDITGRRLEVLQAHDGWAVWEAKDYSSGVYFARVVGEREGRALRLVLVR